MKARYLAGAILAASVPILAVLVFYPRPDVQFESSGLTDLGSRPAPQPDLAVPRRPDSQVPFSPVDVSQHAPLDDYTAAPCDGCLDARGALDVVATYLFHVNPNHLGLRLELYSDIPGDPTKQRLPKLPAGLVGAPFDYSISEMVLPAVKNPNETWVVWVQVGWLDDEGLEYRILDGDFPPVARSWPPLKYEKFILVDAPTGMLDASGIYSLAWELGKPVPDHPVFLFGDTAQRAAQERADYWFGKVRSEQARRSGKRVRLPQNDP